MELERHIICNFGEGAISDYLRETASELTTNPRAIDQFCFAADDDKNPRDIPAGVKVIQHLPICLTLASHETASTLPTLPDRPHHTGQRC